MLYLDASLIISAITNEPRSPDAYAWLSERADQDLAVSPWVTTEVSSALSLKLRTGQIDLASRNLALAAYHALVADSLRLLEVVPNCFTVAAGFVDQHGLGLRAADALHLGVAAEYGATVCTMDRRLSEAAPLVGVPAMLV